MAAHFHFAENALTLHFFLEHAERLLDIIILDYNLNQMNILLVCYCFSVKSAPVYHK